MKRLAAGLLLLALLPGCSRGPEDHIVAPPTGREMRNPGRPDTANTANRRPTAGGGVTRPTPPRTPSP
jgi:hypothetical protein